MSQQQSTVLNGPNDGNQTAQNTVKSLSPTSPDQIRPPPLNRVDSRANLSPRTPGFPSQQFRPQLPNQQLARGPFAGSPQFPRAQLPRSPSSNQVNPILNIRPGTPNPAAQAGLRQPPPFVRPQISPIGRPPGLLPQKSVPIGKPQEVARSQTLDSTEKNVMESLQLAPKILEEEETRNEFNKKMFEESLSGDEKIVKQEEERTKSPFVQEKEEILIKKVEDVIGKPVETRDQRSPTPDKVRVDVQTKLANEPPQNIRKTPEPPKQEVEKKEVIEKPKTLRPASRSPIGRTEKSPPKSEGDNDSGVDESTQGNDQSSNGDQNSPRKSSGKGPGRNTASPTKSRSVSRGSKSPHVKTPDSPTPSTPGSVDKKKVSMNKVQVGGTPSPNLKEVRSKIGSLQNTSYKPGGGQVKIETKKIDLANVHSKVAAKNEKYVPGGGERKIEHRKLNWNASSKIGSLDNATHKPKGGDKKIETKKLDFKDKAKPKVGSKDNMKYQPGGGDVKIETKKVDIKAKSKVNSLDNVKHKPGGGDKKIFDDKDYLRQKSGASGDHNSFNGSQPVSPVKEYYSPEVNIISPTQEKVTLVETAEVTKKPERTKDDLDRSSKVTPRLTRTFSLRSKTSSTPRNNNSSKAPWRF